MNSLFKQLTWFTLPIIFLLLAASVSLLLPFQSSYVPNGKGENSPNMGYDLVLSYGYEWFLPWLHLSAVFLIAAVQLLDRKSRVILVPIFTLGALVVVGYFHVFHRVFCCAPFIPTFKTGYNLLTWSSIVLVLYLNVFAWRKPDFAGSK